MRTFLLTAVSALLLAACQNADLAANPESVPRDSIAIRIDTVLIVKVDTLADTVRMLDTVFREKEIVRILERLKIDTVRVTDTVKVPVERVVLRVDTVALAGDTVYRNDTAIVADTLLQVDTLLRVDTLIRKDTVFRVQVRTDTLVRWDTLVVRSRDTVHVRDTLRIIDTVFVPKDSLRVTVPDPVSGPVTGLPGVEYEFSATGSTCGLQGVEYRLSFGEGGFSGWGAGPFRRIWPSDGGYDVRAQARCSAYPEILSGWSPSHRIAISSGSAERSVSGFIGQSQTWSKDTLYRIVGNTVFNDSASLTIQPGTRIRFESGSLTVGIRFQALGTPADSIFIVGGDIVLRWRSSDFYTWNPDGSYRQGPRFDYCSMSGTTLTIHDDDAATYGYGAYVKHSRILEFRSDDFFARNRGSYVDSCILGGYRLWSGRARLLRSYVDNLKLDMSVDYEVSQCYLKNVTIGAGSYAISAQAFHHNTVEAFQVSYSGHGPFRDNNLIGPAPVRVDNLTTTAVDFGGNYWGVATTSEMDLLGPNANIPAIQDLYDNPILGKVRYEGWLPVPVPNAAPPWQR